MPIREFEARFTKSELAIVAWRSQEMYAQTMGKVRVPTAQPGMAQEQFDGSRPLTDRDRQPALPARFFNEAGELDLRQVTGVEAHRFLTGSGIPLPMILPTATDKPAEKS